MGQVLRTSAAAGVLAAAASLVSAPAAQADILTFSTLLSGAAEAPPNASPGVGFAHIEYDTVTHLMRVRAQFVGLLGNTTAAHVHSATAVPGAGTAPVASQTPSYPGFPLGVNNGVFDNTFDMSLASSYNPSFITAHGGTPTSAEAFLIDSMSNGTAYFNVHSSSFPGGEIRGFLRIPTPGSAGVMAIAGLAAARRRRR